MRSTIILALLFLLLMAGCSGSSGSSPTSQPAVNTPSPGSTQSSDIPTPASIEEQQQEIDACYANPDHPIGKQIAADYADLTSYTEVMDWFCSGYEFEDILTALQTAEVSDFHPEILLTMLEYGQTWEEIWAEIGLD